METDPFGDGSKSYTLESSVDGKVTQRYMVVPSLGYVCPKVQLYDFDSGNLVDEYLAREFVLHQRSGLYYPTIYIESRHDASSGKLIEKREYKINQKALFLNETMHPNEFSLDVSEGIKIVDFREGKNIQYTADASGVLSLAPGGLDLKKMPWLRKVGDLPMLQSQDRYLFLRL